MSYKIELTDNFKKEAKKLIKKYASLKAEIAELGQQLSQNPAMGTPLGNDVYKIRLSVASKQKGKSGGARVISFVKVVDETVFCCQFIVKEIETASVIRKLKNC